MDKSTFFTSLGSYLKANKAFFLSIVFILLATGGYFWWQAGFSFEIGRFFASQGDYCESDGDCGSDETCVNNACESSGPGCGVIPPAQQTCDGGDCDDDGADNPVVYNGNDCDDGNSCVGGQSSCRQMWCGDGTCQSSNENMSSCATDCGSSSDCESIGNQFCYTGPNSCPAGTTSGSGSCSSGQCCNPTGAPYCGDGTCNNGETHASCGADCPAPEEPTCPCGGGSWGDNGITVCKTGGNIDASQRCTQMGPNQNARITVAICNGSSQSIYSREALFYTETQTCGAHADNPGHANVSGDTELDPGEIGSVTYSFNTGDCGSWQLDDTWGPDGITFVIGQVINTGVSCAPSQHLACRNNACAMVSGGGANEDGCTAVGQSCGTPPTHLACQNNACVQLSGGGGNLDGCTTVGQVCGTTPTHTECNAERTACVSVQGTGTNQCTTAADCAPTSHTECNTSRDACVVVQGTGTNQCATAADCSPATHTECNQSRACVAVNGAGENQCSTDADCNLTRTLSCSTLVRQADIGQVVQFTAQGGTGTYAWYAPGGSTAADTNNPFSVSYTRAGFKTVTVTSGGDQATCTVTILEAVESHLACTRENTCARVAGAGENECDTNQDCLIEQFHTVCTEQNTCESIVGPGENQCSTNADCESPTHLACNDSNACVEVAGAGQNLCDSDADCTTQNHSVCNESRACVSISGPGANECSTNADCAVSSELQCQPANQTVCTNRTARFTATGGESRTYIWSAPDGRPDAATGPAATFETEYRRTGSHVVTVTSGSQTATCNVTARSCGGGGGHHLECRNNTCAMVSGSGSDECTPEGSFCGSSSSPLLSLTKTVKNITQNSTEQEGVNANPTNTVEFSLRVTSNGTGTATSVTIRDSLPAGLTYVAGSTSIDNVPAADGLLSTGLNLGDMPRGRSITVRFRATVASASFFHSGTTVLINTAYARASNAPEVSDVAFVTVVNSSSNLDISLTKMGRNLTREETAESSPVRSSPAETIEFILRVRNTSSRTLNNVIIRDVLPQAITLVPGSVKIGGVSAADSITAAGLSLGNLTAGQEVVVTFSGLVATASQLPTGTTTVINTATVTATGVPTLTAQLPIIIANGGIVIPPVNTGPGETTVLALIISAIITLLYVGYTSTESYRRQEAGAIAKESRKETSDFNK